MNKYSVLLDGRIDADIVDSGQAIDVLAKACGQYTSNEAQEQSIDGERYVIEYVIGEYDHEARVLAWLNEDAGRFTDDQVISAGPFIGYSKYVDAQEKAKKPVLLPGAWLALECPEAFKALVKHWTERMDEAAWSYYDYDLDIADELCGQVQKAIDDYQVEQYNEWLKGDYRNWAGVLKEAARAIGCEAVEYDEKKDQVTLIFTEGEAEDFMFGHTFGNEDEEWSKLSEREKQGTLETAVIDWINGKAGAEIAKQHEETRKRREQWQREKEIREKREQEAEAERIAKLKAMTK